MPSLDDETERFLEAWMRVRQIIQAANFNQFHRAGLSATQFMTVNVIPGEGITLSELARKLNLSPATLSQTVDSLEDRGYVRRAKSSLDARKTNILATVEGERIQNAASGEFHRTMARLFAKMGAKSRSALVDGLEQLVLVSEMSRSGDERKASFRVDAEPRSARSSRPLRRK